MKKLFLLLLMVATMSVAFAQNRTISGVVTYSGDGEPLAGATIMPIGGGHGCATDVDGKFTLSVPANVKKVRVTFVGMLTQEVPVGQDMKIVMDNSDKKLDDVIVVAYGTAKRSAYTGSAAVVDAEKIENAMVTDAVNTLKGSVPGVQITQANGQPGVAPTVRIRGVGSINADANPLYVVDGMPYDGNISNINSMDIESMTVLKDAAAAALYGARGANGVILVTTKKGSKDGSTHTSYSTTLAWDKVKRELDMMTAQDYRDVRLGWGDRGIDLGGNVDWLDAVTRTGFTQQHTLTVSGGNDKSNYRVSADYRKANGIDLRSEREEYGARASVMHTTKGGLFTVSLNVAPRVIYRDNADWGVFRNAIEANPTTPIMDPENPSQYYNFQGQVVGSNPVELMKLEKDHADTKLLDWDGTLKLNLLPLLSKDGNPDHTLSTQVMFADHQYSNDNSWFRPSTSTLAINNGYEGEASRSYSSERQYVLEWLANYSGRFADSHNVKAMLGYSYQYSHYSGFNASNKDFPNDGLGPDNLGSGELAKEEGEVLMGSYRNDAKLISFFGRISYDYKGKYLMTASLRHEGSSKFGANHKWGDFPAVSVGWRISQEEFMKGFEWLNDLKLRADYGVTGNQDFGSYISLNTMTGFGYYFYNGKYFQVWGPSKNVNPDLKWEKGKNWNVGLDFSMFNNRFYGSLNYFSRHQQDLLGNYKVSVPPYLFDETYVNVGTMKNTGFEFDLNFNAVQTKDFDYSFSVIGTVMSNKFVDFSNSKYVGQDFYSVCGTEDPYPYYNLQRIEKGKSLGNFYMWKYAGITTDGDWLVYDRDGDIIRASQATEADRQVVGNGMPKFTMSTSHNFRYKNFDLALFFRGAFGFDIFNIHDFYYGTRNFTGNVLCKAFGKNFDINPNANPVVSDYFLERGDYFKLDQVTLGYTLPLASTRFLNRLRVYGTVKNVFTLTKFTGVDPSTYQVNGLTPGGQGSRTYYPSTRQFILGLQLDF